MRIPFKIFLPLLTFCTLSSPVRGQEDESVWSLSVDSVTVRTYRNRSQIKADAQGAVVWDMEAMSRLPQILGNADPVHYAQMLPGIQTNNEYRSGINIEGCDSQHNFISIGGIPVYNVCHLLGFFSTFNTDHYPSMSIARGVQSAGTPNRLGGILDMHLDAEHPERVGGTVSLGLVSSQGTLRLPLGGKTSLALSLRGSYVNLLYGSWLRFGGQQLDYSFYDGSMTLVHCPDDRNTLILDLYGGSDIAGLNDDQLLVGMKARWGNCLAAGHWKFDNGDGLTAETVLYATAYRNRFAVEMEDIAFRLPSGITDAGIKSDVAWRGLSFGAEAVWHGIRPQALEQQGGIGLGSTSADACLTNAVELSLYAGYWHTLARNLTLSGGVRGSLFIQGASRFAAVDPSLRIVWDNSVMQFSASYAIRHQYLFQTGFTDSGLPTEFWIPAGTAGRPQYAHEFALGGGSWLFNRRFRVSLDIFYRRLCHQLGYKGSVFDFVNSVYDIDRYLMHGRGENYGASIMFAKSSGSFTGWISYTYTRARRTFDETGREKSYPASHERPHEMNLVAAYDLGSHWNFGGTAVLASGTPFTAAESLYILDNNLIMKFGDYNGARLHPYFRLDISANYQWTGRRNLSHRVNLSVYNVTCRNNELFYYLSKRDGAFAYRPVSFVFRLLPSLSYNLRF